MKLPLVTFACVLAGLGTSFGWGDQGHNAIWAVAQRHLTPTARIKVDQILAGTQLAYTATWLDKARDAARNPPTGPFATDPETITFNTSFQDNAQWHYVDLPEGARSYAESIGFTSRSDVVHHLNQAIKVLEGKDNSMTPAVALRVLAHLVGDIHQPLHCVAGFFDPHDKAHPALVEGAPAARFKAFGDRGGNLLFFGHGRSDELHAFFDARLVVDVASWDTSFQKLAEAIEAMLPAENAKTPGDFHTWAEAWADESLKIANDVYHRLTFGPVTMKPDANGRETMAGIAITLPGNFETQETTMVAHRLTQAAARLAELLNRILDPH